MAFICRVGRSGSTGAGQGTTTPYFPGRPGPELEDYGSILKGYANIKDVFAKKHAPCWSPPFAKFDDGHAIHAPVGTYKPNAFGLFDVHGNVWEWCETAHSKSSGSVSYRVYRGGSFGGTAYFARSGLRGSNPPTHRHSGIGARPARALH